MPNQISVARSPRVKDLAGQRFGKWTVIDYAAPKRGQAYWNCRCECGRVRPVRGSHLQYGTSVACRSCAHRRRMEVIDLAGHQYGLWTVIRFSHRTGSRWQHRYWECRCECGATHLVAASKLRSGQPGGCVSCKGKRRMRPGFHEMWSRMRRAAGKYGRAFDISPEYVLALLARQNSRCALSGLDIAIAHGFRASEDGGSTASLDRIDNSRGYVEGNVQWVHKHINRMKWTHSEAEFIELCRRVASHTEGRDG